MIPSGRGDAFPVAWVGAARAEVRALPRTIRRTMGIALWFAQQGQRHPAATGMRGVLAAVTEVRVDAVGGTWRVMYTTRLAGTVYVLAGFQTKAHRGVATPKHLLDRVAQRLALARTIHRERRRGEG